MQSVFLLLTTLKDTKWKTVNTLKWSQTNVPSHSIVLSKSANSIVLNDNQSKAGAVCGWNYSVLKTEIHNLNYLEICLFCLSCDTIYHNSCCSRAALWLPQQCHLYERFWMRAVIENDCKPPWGRWMREWQPSKSSVLRQRRVKQERRAVQRKLFQSIP